MLSKKLNKIILPLVFSLISAFPAFSIELYDTSQKFADKNGQYVQQRQGLHKNILNKYNSQFTRLTPRANPNSVFMAGGPGAGKSYTLDLLAKAGLINLKSYVMINSDDIKEMIPEYSEFKKVDPKQAANLVHNESSDLKEMVLNEAIKRRVNFILDGTFSNVEQSKNTLKKLKGYKSKIVFVDAPTEVLLKRVEERGKKTGRFVPPEYVKSAAEQVRKSINELSKTADNTFYIMSSDNTSIEEIRWKNGKKQVVKTPINRLSKKQVSDFKKILDP